ncbi:hypothetical protein, partial [Burkholderia sp.]|uniref:hypothetical protein n=1 Tax=Burkholderia sp. TaxID=36773 RepID=UPI002588D4A6
FSFLFAKRCSREVWVDLIQVYSFFNVVLASGIAFMTIVPTRSTIDWSCAMAQRGYRRGSCRVAANTPFLYKNHP